MKMLVAIGLLAGVSTLGHAQGVRLGLRLAGARSSFMRTAELEEGSARTSFGVGVVVKLPVPRVRELYLQPEVLYSTKGNRIDYTSGAYYYTSMKMTRLHYAEVVVPLQWRVLRWESSRWTTTSLVLEAGPNVAYLVGARYLEDTRRDRVRWRHTLWDAGYVAGIGVQFGNKLGVGVRYSRGLRNVYRQEDAYQPEAYNAAFQLLGTYYVGRHSRSEAAD